MEMDMSATAAEQTQQARQTLATLLVDCERSVVAIATEFEDLADDAREMLALAAGVVGCVANESVMSVLPMVETFPSIRRAAATGLLPVHPACLQAGTRR
jgi:hypothetical protein